MHKRSLTIQALLLLIFGGINCGKVTGDQDYRSTVTHANHQFSLSLYKTLSRHPGNLAVSPFSVNVLLSVLWMGAAGETARELAEGLYLPNNRTILREGFKQLLLSLKGDNVTVLDIGNSLYIQTGYHLHKHFYNTALNIFQASIELVDFANTQHATHIINHWAEEKTHHKIKDIISPGLLGTQTTMVALNAIYFKGIWKKAFSEQLTIKKAFHTTPETNVEVTMMSAKDKYFHREFADFKLSILKLLYQPTRDFVNMSMIILLPDDVDGLTQLEHDLPSLNLNHMLHTLHYREVTILLPRFKIENTHQLVDILKKMGIRQIFENADLPDIVDTSLSVSTVVQKVFIEVSENGTEAAAATELSSERIFTPASSVFRADHPFLYLVRDDVTETILFMGRVVHPQ